MTIATENTAGENRHPLERNVSVDSFQREFELDDVYPYIKTGIASIIEDEVTQRFVAEELKVNLNIFLIYRQIIATCYVSCNQCRFYCRAGIFLHERA